jgi:hypothetical protein
MLLSRPPIAADPRLFGKRFDVPAVPAGREAPASLAVDLRLFALTFTAGFLFVSVLIA